MPIVKVTFKEVNFEVEADTIGELKEKIGTDKLEVDVDDWRLFQFGFVLPEVPETKLEDFRDDEGDIQLNLVRPEEPPRSGKPRTILSDKTRFIVRGTRSRFEILELRPMKTIATKLKPNYKFFGKDKFGVVTSIIGHENEPSNRRVQFEVYEVKQDGHVVLLTSPHDDNDVNVFLVPDNSTEPTASDMIQLISSNTKSYHEDEIITPREQRQLIATYMKAVFQGIAKVASAAI